MSTDTSAADATAMPEHTIIIHRAGPRTFAVTWNGKTIVDGSKVPEFAACRALQALGVTGTIVTFHDGSPTPCLRMTINKGAKLAVDDGNTGPRIVRYREFEPPDAGET